MGLEFLFRDDGEEHRVRLARLAGAGAVCLLAFFLAASLLGAALSAGGVERSCEVLSEKIEHLARHGGEYDLVFIGSSLTYRHIDPLVFDAELHRRGVDLRSLNLGVFRMTFLDALTLLDRLAETGGDRLRFVVIEPSLYLDDGENWAHDRALMSHDAERTGVAISYSFSGSPGLVGLPTALRRATFHALSFLGRRTNLGLAGPVLLPCRDGLAAPEFASPDMRREGFLALDEERHERFLRRRRYYLSNAEAYDEFLGQREAPSIDDLDEHRARVECFQLLLDRVRALGARPVLVAAPGFISTRGPDSRLAALRELAPEVVTLNYRIGHGHEGLYRRELWYDGSHLNAEGARIWSLRLAADLAPFLGTEGK